MYMLKSLEHANLVQFSCSISAGNVLGTPGPDSGFLIPPELGSGFLVHLSWILASKSLLGWILVSEALLCWILAPGNSEHSWAGFWLSGTSWAGFWFLGAS